MASKPIKRSGGSLKPSTAQPTKSKRRAGVKSGQKTVLPLKGGPINRRGK